MSDFPSVPLTAAQQQRLLGRVYKLLESQVRSYYRRYHGGSSTSVPAETAQALLESIWYTLDRSGEDFTRGELEPLMERGQQVLEEEIQKLRQMYRLLCATLGSVQSDFYLDTLAMLGRYLDIYDGIHFAHRAPPVPDYPFLWQPQQVPGPAYAAALLRCMWLEDQILEALDGEAVRALLESLGEDFYGAPQNLCEQPLCNAVGRALLGLPAGDLTLTAAQRQSILETLRGVPLRPSLEKAMDAVLYQLALPDKAAADYARHVLDVLEPRLAAALPGRELRWIFPSP